MAQKTALQDSYSANLIHYEQQGHCTRDHHCRESAGLDVERALKVVPEAEAQQIDPDPDDQKDDRVAKHLAVMGLERMPGRMEQSSKAQVGS